MLFRSPLVISENHRAQIPEMCISFLVFPQYEKRLPTYLIFSNDSGKINPTRSPSPEVNEVAADPEETNSDKEEAGSFDEDIGGFDEEEGGGFNEEGEQHFNNKGGVFSAEEVAQDSNLKRRGKDTDGVVDVEGEKVGKECEMLGIWDDLGSV